MKKNTRFNLIIGLTYALTIAGGMFLGFKFLKDQGFKLAPSNLFASASTNKVNAIINLIDKNYVDDVNADSLQNLPIDSLLQQLDPHSLYLPAKNAEDLAETLNGNFEGIGIQYYILKDTLLVTNVFANGPAALAGLKLGDKILKIDSLFVSGRQLPPAEMMGKIKGKRGTPVQLLLQRQNDTNPFLLTIKRARVEVNSIDAAYLLNPETAYIRISNFGFNTEKDFVEAIKLLKAKGMKKLVLDLRDNGGGYLNAATSLANQFLAENKLIVYTQGKHEPRTDYFTTGGGEFEQGKLAVLINENSASASEIFAGAIQDLNRGIIIGRRSFGKGLVQEQFAFDDGSALNLTIARYYTPLGRSIQKSYKKGYAAYQHEIEGRFIDGELTEDPVKLKDSLLKKPMPTNKKTIALGGIHPDVYVKLDTLGYNKFYSTLIAKKILVDFVFDLLANRYTPTYLEQNLTSFNVSDADIKDLQKYIQQKNIVIDNKQFLAAKSIIYTDLKALLYKYHLGDAGFYKASNLTDNVVKQALNKLQ